MAEKIIPDLEFFANEINNELRADLPAQRVKITERLMNFPPEKISELHVQDWYNDFWKLLDIGKYLAVPPEQIENICAQIRQFAARVNDPVRTQYFALALLLFGKAQDFQKLANQKLWSKNLREDFETFAKFNQLTSSNLAVRAHLRRNQQIKNFLQNKYAALINKYSAATLDNCPKVLPKDYKIWYCWFQGEENLPPLVRCCYNSLKMNAGKYKIIFIDEKNYADYVKLPEYIVKKFIGGGISRTHFSDIIRINLLENHGGLWLDSTILVTEPLENHKNFWKMPYFTQKFYQDKSLNIPQIYVTNPSYARWAGFIQGAAILHNPFLSFMKDFYNEYWREFNEVIDYVIMDFMMDIAYDNIPVVRKMFDEVPINNTETNTLVFHLNDSYSKYPYDKILKGNFLNKLNWRVNLDLQTPDTVFSKIRKKYLGE